MNNVPNIWALVQAHIDDTGVTEATIAKRAGTKPQTINSWKARGLTKLPEAWLIKSLAREVRVPYREMLDAVLRDIRYLPEEVVGDERDSAPNTPGPEGPAPDELERLRAEREAKKAKRSAARRRPQEPDDPT
ncbi:hypothetical protein [Aeromicrobium piscarium]|uniref:Uncharacterized protein n=1 Tax=Aeromicrobium piscarium TaxID=2590901 RepID=A0A554SNZ9_9ACTN|nr:hypothetical protein [Aeromicrobium piscarium]TSD68085.1 hypothetical protein FNM00_00375 [Aeromicrobium piscarium]